MSSLCEAKLTVADVYESGQSFSFRARQRRFSFIREMIERIIARKGHCRIADIGGTQYYWRIAQDFLPRPDVEIHLINLDHTPAGHGFVSVAGNACELQNLDDNSFDLVHSNSVIEHVGSWEQMTRMAHNVKRLAPAYYVQTPNFWFPIEQHFRVPFFQFMPEQLRYRILMNFNCGFGGQRKTVSDAMRAVQSSNLLETRQLRELFPDAQIKRERFGPFTKSLMAVRDGETPQSSLL